MVRNYLLIPILIIFFSILSAGDVFASVIYSNDFTSSFENYQEFFGHCTVTTLGLSCTSSTNEQYMLAFPKVSCISADFTDPTTQSDSLDLLDGTDTFAKNFVAIRPSLNGHIGIDTANSFEGVALSSITTPDGKHNYMLCKDGDSFLGYVDQNLVVSYTEQGHAPISFMIGSSGTGTITNLVATDTIFTSPTPSTSPTPTPFPDNHLNVPLIKQTSDPWQKFEYDSAHIWAKFNKTIHDWGCAITDVAMVFQFHGITRMPDNSLVNPDSINKWLKSQPDGYVGNGLVNWLAVSRLSLLAKNSGHNPNFSSADALEFSRAEGNTEENKNLLADDVKVLPDILEEPGHFIVATGTKPNPNTFYINDPYFSRTLLTDTYNNSFDSINRFIPTHTDLSYILLVGPENIDFDMKTSSGSAIGTQFIQQPLQNPLNPSQTSGSPIKMFYIPKPIDDTYTLTLPGNMQYNVTAFDYDKDGNAKIFYLSGSGTQTNPDTYTLTFSKIDRQQDSIEKHSVLDKLESDINHFSQTNEIKNGAYKELSEKITEIKKRYSKQHFLQGKIELTELLVKLIIWSYNETISGNAYQTLVEDITYLLIH